MSGHLTLSKGFVVNITYLHKIKVKLCKHPQATFSFPIRFYQILCSKYVYL